VHQMVLQGTISSVSQEYVPAEEVVQLNCLNHSLKALIALLLCQVRHRQLIKRPSGCWAGCLPDSSWGVRVQDLIPQGPTDEVWPLRQVECRVGRIWQSDVTTLDTHPVISKILLKEVHDRHDYMPTCIPSHTLTDKMAAISCIGFIGSLFASSQPD